MFECRLANIDEIEKKWNKEIQNHPNDNRWGIWKEIAIQNIQQGNRICFYGFLNNKIIAECTAIISKEDSGLDLNDLVKENGAYLEAFRVDKEYRGKGYFSQLYKFMEDYLKKQGFKRLVVGVEPCEVRNAQIYFHYGYTNFLLWRVEKYPPKQIGIKSEEIMVNYYFKNI